MEPDSSPLRLAILTAGSTPVLETLAADPRRGLLYEIAAMIETGGRPRNLRRREKLDAETAAALRNAGAGWIILAGYPWIVTAPLLQAFPGRILALHDADLTLRDDDGTRRYKGLHAVRDALLAGEKETRSSAFLVTENVGEGPLFLLGGAYRVPPLVDDARRWGAADLLTSYAELHRQWMIRDAWGPMLLRIVEMLAAGEIRIVGGVAWVDGVPGPCRMGKAPPGCDDRDGGGIPQSCPFLSSQ